MRKLILFSVVLFCTIVIAQERGQQYVPQGNAFVCENGTNRFTRALYGSHTDWRLETSDRPVFAVVKKGHHRHIRFLVNGVPLDSTDYCKAWYEDGVRRYRLNDSRWKDAELTMEAVAMPDGEKAVWRISASQSLQMKALVYGIAQPKLSRNGDIGADPPGVFEAAGEPLQTKEIMLGGDRYLEVDLDSLVIISEEQGKVLEVFPLNLMLSSLVNLLCELHNMAIIFQ